MHLDRSIGFARVAFVMAVSALALGACSKEASDTPAGTSAAGSDAGAPAEAVVSEAAPGAASSSASAVTADSTDTLTGVTLASFTGDAAKGEAAFMTCKTCHAIEPGVNKVGPSLNAIVGRVAGSVAGYTYSPANKNSGITWSPEKLFQYLEKPQRVVPGTKMAFPGIPDPQKRADVIAYLQAN